MVEAQQGQTQKFIGEKQVGFDGSKTHTEEIGDSSEPKMQGSDNDTIELGYGPMRGVGSVDYLSRYFSVQNVPIYRDKKEREYWICVWMTEYHAPGRSAQRKKELQLNVLGNIFYLLLYVISKRNYRKDLFDEAIQNCLIIVLYAMDNFDPTRGSKFASYLPGYLKQAMKEAEVSDPTVRIPAAARKKALSKVTEGKSSSCDNIARHVGANVYIGTDVVDDMDDGYNSKYEDACMLTPCAYSSNPVEFGDASVMTGSADSSMSPPVQDNPYTSASLISGLYDSTDPDEFISSKQFMDVLEYLVSEESSLLSEREKVVIKYRFGVFRAPQLKLEQVSQMFKSLGWRGSKEWIFQLEKRALKKMRKFFKAQGVTSFA